MSRTDTSPGRAVYVLTFIIAACFSSGWAAWSWHDKVNALTLTPTRDPFPADRLSLVMFAVGRVALALALVGPIRRFSKE